MHSTNSRLGLLLAIVWTAPATTAQFFNRAIWLGFENEGVRPNYRQGTDHFLDRMSYTLAPPWADVRLDPFADRARFAGGSVTGTELTLDNQLHVGHALGETFRVGFDYIQSEHQDARYERFGLGLEYAANESTAAFLQLEGFAEKDRSDIGFGAALFRTPDSELRATLTFVDFSANNKGRRFVHDTRPIGLHVAGHAGGIDDVQVSYELGVQAPFVERDVANSDRFEMHRSLGAFELRVPLAESSKLVVAADAEWTEKSFEPLDPAGALREDFDRDMQRVRVEFWKSFASGHELSCGLSWLHLRSDGLRPNDPANTLGIRRTEALVLARARVPLDGRWFLEPQLFAGHVTDEERIGGLVVDRSDGFQGKAGVPVGYRFDERSQIMFYVTVQLDEAAFGGGGVSFRADF